MADIVGSTGLQTERLCSGTHIGYFLRSGTSDINCAHTQGHWTFSLLEFNLSLATIQPELYVCSNLCQDSIMKDRESHLLRLVNLKKAMPIIYNYPYQVPLRLREFQNVRVYIRDDSNQPASFLKGVTTVTLLLKKNHFLKYSNGLQVTPMAAVEKKVKVKMKEAIKERTLTAQMRRRTVKSKPTLKKKTPQRQLKRKHVSGHSIFTPDQKISN